MLFLAWPHSLTHLSIHDHNHDHNQCRVIWFIPSKIIRQLDRRGSSDSKTNSTFSHTRTHTHTRQSEKARQIISYRTWNRNIWQRSSALDSSCGNVGGVIQHRGQQHQPEKHHVSPSFILIGGDCIWRPSLVEIYCNNLFSFKSLTKWGHISQLNWPTKEGLETSFCSVWVMTALYAHTILFCFGGN